MALLYERLDLAGKGLSRKAFEYAMQGFAYLRRKGDIRNDEVISIVDFSLPLIFPSFIRDRPGQQ